MYGNYGNRDGNRGFGGGRDNRDFGRTPPVNEGDELDVRIEAVGEKGDGVAKKDGFVLFVPNVKEGDEVHIKVTKVLRKVGFAEVIGQAKGPIAAAAPAPKPRSSAEEKAAEIREVEQNAQRMEDSEDFGDEEPVDEPAVEHDDFDDEPQADEPEDEPVKEKQSLPVDDADDDVIDDDEEKESF